MAGDAGGVPRDRGGSQLQEGRRASADSDLSHASNCASLRPHLSVLEYHKGSHGPDDQAIGSGQFRGSHVCDPLILACVGLVVGAMGVLNESFRRVSPAQDEGAADQQRKE